MLLYVFQHIWTMETQHQPESVRAKLPFDSCRRAMHNARKSMIPVCPNDIVEVIQSLENRRNPPLYQDMYLGYVKHDVPASKYLFPLAFNVS